MNDSLTIIGSIERIDDALYILEYYLDFDVTSKDCFKHSVRSAITGLEELREPFSEVNRILSDREDDGNE